MQCRAVEWFGVLAISASLSSRELRDNKWILGSVVPSQLGVIATAHRMHLHGADGRREAQNKKRDGLRTNLNIHSRIDSRVLRLLVVHGNQERVKYTKASTRSRTPSGPPNGPRNCAVCGRHHELLRATGLLRCACSSASILGVLEVTPLHHAGHFQVAKVSPRLRTIGWLSKVTGGVRQGTIFSLSAIASDKRSHGTKMAPRDRCCTLTSQPRDSSMRYFPSQVN